MFLKPRLLQHSPSLSPRSEGKLISCILHSPIVLLLYVQRILSPNQFLRFFSGSGLCLGLANVSSQRPSCANTVGTSSVVPIANFIRDVLITLTNNRWAPVSSAPLLAQSTPEPTHLPTQRDLANMFNTRIHIRKTKN